MLCSSGFLIRPSEFLKTFYELTSYAALEITLPVLLYNFCNLVARPLDELSHIISQ